MARHKEKHRGKRHRSKDEKGNEEGENKPRANGTTAEICGLGWADCEVHERNEEPTVGR